MEEQSFWRIYVKLLMACVNFNIKKLNKFKMSTKLIIVTKKKQLVCF